MYRSYHLFMHFLASGQYYGTTNRTLKLGGLVITDTAYTHDRVDWHYHENPYITFILQGRLNETAKKDTYRCGQGDLLFHNWDEAHTNSKPPGFTRGCHVELGPAWLKTMDYNLNRLQGSFHSAHPLARLLAGRLHRETMLADADPASHIAIEETVVHLLDTLAHENIVLQKDQPSWVKKIRELLNDGGYETLSLVQLASLLDLHPVHLSRDFRKYFGCGLSDYIRKVKIGRSLLLLADPANSLAGISFDSGFSDQSHFGRCFREIMHTSPKVYRQWLLNK